jgi:hypothetical protein
MSKYLLLIFSIFVLFFGCKSSNKNNEIESEYTNETINEEDEKVLLGKYAWIAIDPLGKRGSLNATPTVCDLYWISENSVTSEIIFYVIDVDKIDFSPLFELVNLEKIYINCYDDSMIDFPDFSGIKKLKKLEIMGSSINSFINIREKLPDIEYLRYNTKDYWGMSETTNFDCISKISSLKEIFLQWGGDFDIKFSDFYGLINLERFQTYTRGIIDFEGSEKLTSLKILEIGSCKQINLQSLGYITTLQILSMGIDDDSNDLSFFKYLTNLKYVSLGNGKYDSYAEIHDGIKEYQTKIDINPMKNLSSLENVFFGGFVIDNFLILNELPHLSEIIVLDSFIMPDNDIKNIKDNILIIRKYYHDH